MSTHITTNAILVADDSDVTTKAMTTKAIPPATAQKISDAEKWQAVLDRDAAQDGRFVYAVTTTGVYCRPSCPSRRALPENVQFFEQTAAAEQAGFRACLRCRPQAASDARTTNVRAICRYIERHLDEPISLNALGDAFGMSPFHLQRTVKAALGITPKEYADSCRMDQLKRNLQSGKTVTHSLYDAGYSSSRAPAAASTSAPRSTSV